MTRRRNSAPRVVSSHVNDDLKTIHGIGPRTEKHLQDSGICTFKQLAIQSPEGLAARIPNGSVHKIRKERWILQARDLTKKKTLSKGSREKEGVSANYQHYQNFALEFLLDEKNKIRRLRITHIQSGDVSTWASWCLKEIIQFLARHTDARIPYVPAAIEKNSLSMPLNNKSDPVLATGGDSPSHQIEPTVQTTPIAIHSIPAVEPLPHRLAHPIQLLKQAISSPDSDNPTQNISEGQDFDTHLMLDISRISLSDCQQLAVAGMLFAKKLGGGSRQVIGEAQTIVSYTPILNLVIHNAPLTPGIYRLEASVRIKSTEETSSLPENETIFSCGLLQVY